MKLRKLPNYQISNVYTEDFYLETHVVTKKFSLPISAGTSDKVSVYRDKESLYVISHNPRIGYIGLQVFNRKGIELTDDIFFQGDEYTTFEEENRLTEWTRPPRIIRALLEYCDY